MFYAYLPFSDPSAQTHSTPGTGTAGPWGDTAGSTLWPRRVQAMRWGWRPSVEKAVVSSCSGPGTSGTSQTSGDTCTMRCCSSNASRNSEGDQRGFPEEVPLQLRPPGRGRELEGSVRKGK